MEKQEFYQEHKKEIETKLSNARTKIMIDTQVVFMSDIILASPMEVSFDLEIPSMGTNGLKILYDPEFVLKLDYKELIFVIVHEGMHNLLLHTDKTRHKMVVDNNKEFNAMVYNISGDVIINAYETVLKIGKCPEGCITSDSNGTVKLTINNKDFEFKEAHKLSLDYIYRKLMKEVPRMPSNGGGGTELKPGQTPTGNDIINGEQLKVEQEVNGKKVLKKAIDNINGDITPEQIKEIEQVIRQQWVKNKQQGKGDAWVNEYLDGLLKPVVNWKNELRAFVIPEIISHETYAKRDRRRTCFADSHDLIFPGHHKEGVELIVNIDTSGSISKSEFDYFVTEIHNIFKMFGKDAVKMKMMLSTDRVYYFEDLDKVEDAKKIKIKSGGTCHLEVFEKASKDKNQMMVCFTDCHTTFPHTKPHRIKKVLVISTTDKKAPQYIGKTINVDLNKIMER